MKKVFAAVPIASIALTNAQNVFEVTDEYAELEFAKNNNINSQCPQDSSDTVYLPDFSDC